MSNLDDGSETCRKILEEHRQNYLEDLPRKLDHVEKLIMNFEGHDSPVALSEEIYREVHSLKGSAGTLGLPIVSSICHQLEEHIPEFSDNYADVCLPYVDLMREVVDIAGSKSQNFHPIERKLYQFQKRLTENKLLVAIVDPSRMNVSILNQVLEPYPLKVTVMTDGLSALSRLLFVQFDLIITTKELPSLSGPALIGALQTTTCANTDVSTILLSSNKLNKEDVLFCPSTKIVCRDEHFSKNITDAVEQLFPELTI